MSYKEIYENALSNLRLSCLDVKDWKPSFNIKDAIIIWTDDGREILFRERKSKKFIEVDTHDTIGSLIGRILPGGIVEVSRRDPLKYYIDGNIWDSRIPEEVLLSKEEISKSKSEGDV